MRFFSYIRKYNADYKNNVWTHKLWFYFFYKKSFRVHFSLQMAKKIKVSLSTLSSSPGKHMVLKFIWLVLIKDRSEFWSQDKQKPLLSLSSLMMSVLWDHNRNKDGPYWKAAYFYHHLHFLKNSFFVFPNYSEQLKLCYTWDLRLKETIKIKHDASKS